MRNPFKKSNKISKKDLSIETIEKGEIKIFLRWKDDILTVLVKPEGVDRDIALDLLEETRKIIGNYVKSHEEKKEKPKGISYIN